MANSEKKWRQNKITADQAEALVGRVRQGKSTPAQERERFGVKSNGPLQRAIFGAAGVTEGRKLFAQWTETTPATPRAAKKKTAKKAKVAKGAKKKKAAKAAKANVGVMRENGQWVWRCACGQEGSSPTSRNAAREEYKTHRAACSAVNAA